MRFENLVVEKATVDNNSEDNQHPHTSTPINVELFEMGIVDSRNEIAIVWDCCKNSQEYCNFKSVFLCKVSNITPESFNEVTSRFTFILRRFQIHLWWRTDRCLIIPRIVYRYRMSIWCKFSDWNFGEKKRSTWWNAVFAVGIRRHASDRISFLTRFILSYSFV